MFKYLFTPKKLIPTCFYFCIGKQNIILIDISIYKDEIIFDRVIETLFKANIYLFWFKNDEDMYTDLDEFITNTTEDCYVLIGQIVEKLSKYILYTWIF